MDDLESGGYYIFHEGKYEKPYFGNTSFDASKNTGSISDRRVAWFMEDWKKIPTLYPGDYVVFYSESQLSEVFNIERFEYLGYTFGISGMERTKSDRYSFDTTGKTNINPSSDAARLLELNAEGVIIDNIGDARLRSGNITRAGTIQGLEKNMSYSTDVYVGSTLKTYVLKADSIALCSMENITTNDYTFLRSKVLRINLPNYLNDGYYSINGSGIFRYVKEKSYTEKTDFNVPNEPVTTEKTEDETLEIKEDKDAVVSQEFTIKQEGKVKIVVTYGEKSDVEYEIADPTAKLIGEAVVYTFTNDDIGEMEMSAELMPGTYKLEIYGLAGRTYDYNIYQEE